jgi:hypothetical protein
MTLALHAEQILYLPGNVTQMAPYDVKILIERVERAIT